jgi:methyl-accepting chemotaxis protein
MSEEKHSNKRKNHFIKKDFQTRFILKFCLLVLAGVVISAVLLFFFSQDTLTSSFQQSRLIVENTSSAILPAILYTSLITLAWLSVATVFVTLFISHRIAGPMFRLERELREIGQGDLTKKVVLRRKDQTAELARCINDVAAGLREKIVDIRTELEHTLETARKKDAPNEIIERLEYLQKRIVKELKT